MAIIDSVKKLMGSHSKRSLYKIKEVYRDGSSYHGYYVEDIAGRGQAYRFKTIKDNIEDIEDENALNKAKDTLINGFAF